MKPDSFNVCEIAKERLLTVEAHVGKRTFFLNVYVPNDGNDRVKFFQALNGILAQCKSDDVVLLGGDFNCTFDSTQDRNDLEPPG